MLDNIKEYVISVGLKKYAPVGIMAGLSALGTLYAAHQGVMEQWGVNYISQWSPDWLTTHQITGPVLLIELDTTSTALIATVVALATVAFRATEHHVATSNAPTPPQGDQPK